MKIQHKKTYKISISKFFPINHPKSEVGKRTFFDSKIMNAVKDREPTFQYPDNIKTKKHTVRENYEYWKKRIDQVNAGEAVLILFEWSGTPYKSKHRDIHTFDKDSGIGVQKLRFSPFGYPFISETGTNEFGVFGKNTEIKMDVLAENDGLTTQDFFDWFSGYDKSEPMAIIHFTKFRY
jgi:hypothetical protein